MQCYRPRFWPRIDSCAKSWLARLDAHHLYDVFATQCHLRLSSVSSLYLATSTNRVMNSIGLSDLAPEIILNICEYLEDFAWVVSFASTSSHFHGICKLNTNTICRSILIKTIGCNEEAVALMLALEAVVGFPEGFNAHQQAIFRTMCTLSTAEAVHLVMFCCEVCTVLSSFCAYYERWKTPQAHSGST